MPEERFVRLVEECGGFEFYQAYANDVDHILGGKDGVFWYAVMKKGTVALIEEKAYLMQEEKWVKDRKPKPVEDAHPHFHYVYGFGDKAVDVSQKYGVTIAFSDIKDPAAGFHLRYFYTGKELYLP